MSWNCAWKHFKIFARIPWIRIFFIFLDFLPWVPWNWRKISTRKVYIWPQEVEFITATYQGNRGWTRVTFAGEAYIKVPIALCSHRPNIGINSVSPKQKSTDTWMITLWKAVFKAVFFKEKSPKLFKFWELLFSQNLAKISLKGHTLDSNGLISLKLCDTMEKWLISVKTVKIQTNDVSVVQKNSKRPIFSVPPLWFTAKRT